MTPKRPLIEFKRTLFLKNMHILTPNRVSLVAHVYNTYIRHFLMLSPNMIACYCRKEKYPKCEHSHPQNIKFMPFPFPQLIILDHGILEITLQTLINIIGIAK